MANALLRLIEPCTSGKFGKLGRIEIDGIDISKIPLTQLRSKITLIPQDPVIFTGIYVTRKLFVLPIACAYMHEFARLRMAGFFEAENLSFK